MLRLLKKLGNAGVVLTISILGLYIFFVNTMPEQVDTFLGYRFYHILTGSMEPVIPMDSLVLVKKMQTDETIQPGTIITFRANRFQDDVVITHYFDHMESGVDGTQFYRTHAYGVETLDAYETTREEILGTYVYHIPYLGNIISFFKSSHAFVMMGILIIIYLLYQYGLYKLEESDEFKICRYDNVFFEHTKINVYDRYITLYGSNDMQQDVLKIENIDIMFYGKNRKMLEKRKLRINITLEEDQKVAYWHCTIKNEKRITGYAFADSGNESDKIIHPLF